MNKPRRIFLEASQTLTTNKDLTTGIQRVVRHLLHCALSEHHDDLTIEPVVFDIDCFRKIDSRTFDALKRSPTLLTSTGSSPQPTFVDKLTTSIMKTRWLHRLLKPVWHFYQSIRQSTLKRMHYFKDKKNEIQLEAGDLLILCDNTWNADILNYLYQHNPKSSGYHLIVLLYDLIPLTHPHLVDSRITDQFKTWLDKMMEIATGFIAISRTAESTLQDYAHQQSKTLLSDSIHLSGQLDSPVKDDVKFHNTELNEVFSRQIPTFLIVGTIDPRKNQLFALRAFHQLWEQGHQAQLLIIGRAGFQCDQIIHSIEQHPEFQKRLFLFHHINDEELNYCYQKIDGLIWPSLIEGFGLPIVEAIQKHKVVFVSDIPIHREVGRNYCRYFSLEQPDQLVEELILYLNQDETYINAFEKPGSFLTWSQVTEDLLERAIKFTDDRQTLTRPHPKAMWTDESR